MSKYNNLIKGEKPTLIDFYADWCAPCKTMSPILSKVKSKMGNRATIIKINVDKNKAISNKHNIRSIPTLILFKNGRQVWRKSGVVQAKEIVAALERIM